MVRLLPAQRPAATARRHRSYVAPESFGGQVARRGTLPPVSPTFVSFPGVTTFARSGKAVRTSAPLRKAIEVYGAPTVQTTIAASGGWSRLVAVLTARTPAGKEIVVSAGGVPTKNGARKVTIQLLNQATFVPKGSRLTLTLASSSTAQSTSNLLYLDLPMRAERPRARGHCRPEAARSAHTGHEVTGRAAAVVLVALALAASAGAAPAADPGVSPTSVLLGGTVPLTGEAAAFGTVGPGAKAYFDYVNAKGGVNGRRIEYRYYDDAYNPAQTVQLTRRLVEQDKVFAIFNSIGTANNLAVREYLNAQKVPQLFAADGSQSIGRSFARYPWTMGFLQSYRGEGNVYGKTIVTARPKARIAVLYENTELGLDMLTGLTRAIAGKGPRIVAKQSYEFTGADVSSQVGLLKASGADTLMLFATPKFFLNAIRAAHNLGWKPQVYIASVSIEPTIMGIARYNAPELTKGALSIAFVKNPNDPVWAKDRAVAPLPLDHAHAQPEREADRRLQLVRHGSRVDDGRDAPEGGEEPHARGRAESRAEPRHPREPVHAPRHPAQDRADGLPPAGAGVPLPLRQQAVGEGERDPPARG